MDKYRVELRSVGSTALQERRYREHGTYLSRGLDSRTHLTLRRLLREGLEEPITGQHIPVRRPASAHLPQSLPHRLRCTRPRLQPWLTRSRRAMSPHRERHSDISRAWAEVSVSIILPHGLARPITTLSVFNDN